MLKLDKLSAGYHGQVVIHELTHTFEQGKITAIIGPNGSGKSTILKAVSGLCQIYGGTIYLGAIKKQQLKKNLFFQQVSYLPQSHTAGAITVARLVLHGRFPHLKYPRHYSPKDYECCDRAMKQMGIESLKDKKAEELSGGERQKAYIAMALAGEMEVYLFDEPTTYLDVRYQMEMLETMRLLRQQGKTVLVVLHDLNHALQTADEIILLDQGRKVFSGTPKEAVEGKQIDQVFHVTTKLLTDDQGNKHLILERRQQ